MKNKFTLTVVTLLFSSLVIYDIYSMRIKNTPVINIYLEAPASMEDPSVLIKKTEKILSTKDFKVSLNINQKKLIDAIREKTPMDVGVSTIGQVFRVYADGKKILPVMAISPHPRFECIAESEIAVPKDSPIKDLKMLQGKRIAISKRAVRTMNFAFPELKEMGIRFSQIYSNQEAVEIMEKFKNKTIDAAILYHSYFKGGSKIRTDLGFVIEGVYEDPDTRIRTLKVTDYQQPCRVLFVAAEMDQKLREKFLSHLKEVLDNEVPFAPFQNLTMISSYRELSPDEIVKMNDFSNHSAGISVESFNQDAK